MFIIAGRRLYCLEPRHSSGPTQQPDRYFQGFLHRSGQQHYDRPLKDISLGTNTDDRWKGKQLVPRPDGESTHPLTRSSKSGRPKNRNTEQSLLDVRNQESPLWQHNTFLYGIVDYLPQDIFNHRLTLNRNARIQDVGNTTTLLERRRLTVVTQQKSRYFSNWDTNLSRVTYHHRLTLYLSCESINIFQ